MQPTQNAAAFQNNKFGCFWSFSCGGGLGRGGGGGGTEATLERKGGGDANLPIIEALLASAMVRVESGWVGSGCFFIFMREICARSISC